MNTSMGIEYSKCLANNKFSSSEKKSSSWGKHEIPSDKIYKIISETNEKIIP